MKRDQIISILCEMHKISGLRVSLHGTDFNEIAAYPEERLPFCAALQKSKNEYELCLECDKSSCRRVEADGRPLIYECRHGLTEVICPLYNFGTLTGYIMMGQVACRETDNEALEAALVNLGYDHAQAVKYARAVPRIKEDLLQSYLKIMTVCAEYMTLINALPSSAPRLPELAKIYLHENYAEKITIKDICRSLGCSKSALLTAFKNEYNTTINSYLCEIRIQEASKMLKNTNLSISDIADACGFYDQSYFSKVFSQHVGRNPSDFRKDFTQ